MADRYSFEERRQNPQCPCIHIVGLEERTKGDMELIRQGLKSYLNDFKQLRDDVKECFFDMEQSAKLFNEGQRKFDKIEAELADQSAKISNLQMELTRMLHLEISARSSQGREISDGNQKSYVELAGKIRRVELGLLFYLLTLFATGHAGQMMSWLVKLAKLGFKI